MPGNPDAIIVGSGPNGLAAAVTLSAAGLRVLVIEGADTPGGGCRTAELTLPGFRHDVCSAAHPLALASPFFRRFGLAARGVRFAEPEVVLAHPLDGGRAAVVTRSVAETAAGLGADAGTYQRLMGPLARDWDPLTQIVLSSLRRPPAHYPPGLLGFARDGLRGAAAIARRMTTPEARALIAGLGGHAMLPLTQPPTGATALMLGALAHGVGWPVAEGGSAQIVDAMTEAIRAAGGQIETGRWVTSLAELPPARAVLLDLAPRGLIGIAGDRLPDRYRRALGRFRYGAGVCKVDFALSGPVPWTSEPCRRAGTLHVAGGYESLAAAEEAVASGRLPASPSVLVVQPSVADPSRAPAGQQTLWAYCHVPAGSGADMTAAITAQIERFAPGFRDLILASAVRTAVAEQAANPNYVGGDIAAGQQTVWQTIARPVPRWNPYRTPVPGLYLCSSSTPPLPGVHGRCGELAAATALRDVFGIRRLPDIGPVVPARPPAAVEEPAVTTLAGRRPSAAVAAGAGLLLLAALLVALGVLARQPGYPLQPLLIALPSAAVGVLVARSQPRNCCGWLLLGIAAALLLSTAAGSWSVLVYRLGHGLPLGEAGLVLYQLWSPALALFLLVILLFPDGRLPSPRWRWAVWAYSLLCAAYLFLLIGVAGDAFTGHRIRIDSYGGLRVIDYPAGRFALTQDAIWGLLLAFAGAFAARQLLTWRRAAGYRRDQLKWLMFGTAIAIACAGLSIPGQSASSGLWAVLNDVLSLGFIALPVSIGVGILRYRLYDIDRVISTAVAYAIVTGVLVGAYAALVATAHGALGGRAPWAVAVETLAAVAVFNPLRLRVQRLIDRRFNRARYDAEATIEAFAARMQDAGDLDTIRADLVAVAGQIMQPAHASVWLRPPAEAADPVRPAEPFRLAEPAGPGPR